MIAVGFEAADEFFGGGFECREGWWQGALLARFTASVDAQGLTCKAASSGRDRTDAGEPRHRTSGCKSRSALHSSGPASGAKLWGFGRKFPIWEIQKSG